MIAVTPQIAVPIPIRAMSSFSLKNILCKINPKTKTIKKRNIVQFMFLAKQINKTFKPGIETLEAKFFDFKEIPWKKIAFPSVSFTLRYYYKNKNKLKNSPIFHDFNGD